MSITFTLFVIIVAIMLGITFWAASRRRTTLQFWAAGRSIPSTAAPGS